MFTLTTNNPIAYDSPDHILPWGTMRDNSTSLPFIEEMENYFQNQPIKIMDLGCSGGQLVIDFHNRGHLAVGLEGSDYSVKHQRANWPEWHNKLLFTCDVTKPYQVKFNDEDAKFDLITAWEVVEHIHPDDLHMFFTLIAKHLTPKGIFVASVSTNHDVIEGVKLHQSVFSETDWLFNILNEDNSFKDNNLEWQSYPFQHKVRADNGSFHILVRFKQ